VERERPETLFKTVLDNYCCSWANGHGEGMVRESGAEQQSWLCHDAGRVKRQKLVFSLLLLFAFC